MLPRGPVHNTMLVTAKRCPQRYVFKYVWGLRAVQPALPLRRGLWVHAMLQTDALKRGLEHDSLLVVPETVDVPGLDVPVELHAPSDGQDPKLFVRYEDAEGTKLTSEYPLSAGGMLKLLTAHVYDWMPNEAKEELVENGLTLPEACKRIVTGYFWKHRDTLADERPLLVEFENATEVEGELYHWRIDCLLITHDGRVVLRDWKSTKSLPTGQAWKLMESQLHLYPVALQPHLDELAKHNTITSMDGKTKLPNLTVEAVEFDFLRTKPPLTPAVNKSGKLSRSVKETDALTFKKAAEQAGIGLDDEVYETTKANPTSPTLAEMLEMLKDNDLFFARHRLPRSQKVTTKILDENASAIALIDALHEDPEEYAYRVTERSCDYGCEFRDLCVADLYGLDTSTIIERDFEPWQPDDLDELREWQLDNAQE